MNINELMGILNGYFSWNKSRMECFATMLIALIKVKTVNLTEIACGFSSSATQDSRYIRIKRFFREFQIDFAVIAAWVIHFFALSGQPLYLSMDRTNWRWGKKDINILMLSIVYKGIAIPLFWDLLRDAALNGTQCIHGFLSDILGFLCMSPTECTVT